jgi:hypothetical protein
VVITPVTGRPPALVSVVLGCREIVEPAGDATVVTTAGVVPVPLADNVPGELDVVGAAAEPPPPPHPMTKAIRTPKVRTTAYFTISPKRFFINFLLIQRFLMRSFLTVK